MQTQLPRNFYKYLILSGSSFHESNDSSESGLWLSLILFVTLIAFFVTSIKKNNRSSIYRRWAIYRYVEPWMWKPGVMRRDKLELGSFLLQMFVCGTSVIGSELGHVRKDLRVTKKHWVSLL